ncbi:hypothetical protein Msil_2936 [Methylocella silvestris BL2]|uniref:Right handed beta helix domain-containing protein n=1 Tax=Methylocella silvestris (strain DSM 15510 / CIP 108128 / LMG 27833 / NCIMB 13906 / BL2) TaxID=395965 RepID=B8EIN5_METSB|nr:hypothetical protein [Methylocella silvestris]ACK51852.1 hypothetical protein Msil_2936 [Methylocella silvestris BL2]
MLKLRLVAGVLAALFFAGATAAQAAPVADAYFSADGRDARGDAIGADCTRSAPCSSVRKALDFLKANVTRNPDRDYTLAFSDRGGPFYLDDTLLFTTAHTPAAGHFANLIAFPGKAPVFSGGTDISGSFKAATLPTNGAPACVSRWLAPYAPLTNANKTSWRYVGVMWVDGRRVQQVISPRKGNPWKTIPGAPGSPVGASVPSTLTATFSAGKPDVSVSDLSKIGEVGETIGFNSSVGSFKWITRYWILSKSAAAGSGTVTLASAPNGLPRIASDSGTSIVQDPVQSTNAGDRTRLGGVNRFPVNGDDALSAYNQTDVKIQLPGSASQSSLVPVESAEPGMVTVNSHLHAWGKIYGGTGYRVWNRFEDLGAGGYAGELYTDRTTGALYYTPRRGEDCASIKVVIPRLKQLLRISNAKADIARVGGKLGAPVGNLNITGVSFQHTNSTVFTGEHDLAGATGGFMGTPSATVLALTPSVVTIGAKQVVFDGIEVTHSGGAGLYMAFGSSHITLKNSRIHEAGGTLVGSGTAVEYYLKYQHNNDAGYYGVSDFGPSTKSSRADLSGCCQTLHNNFIFGAGEVSTGASCVSFVGLLKYEVTYNSIHDCTSFGLANAQSHGERGAPYFSGLYDPYSYESNISHNEIYYCGYETNLDGVSVPGSSMANDFGCFYSNGPVDGAGDGSQQGLTFSYNSVHDVSSGAYQTVMWNGRVRPHGYDGVLDYHDGNISFGLTLHHNLFYNRAKVNGYTPYANRLAQHTGNLRDKIYNNIFASVFPEGYAYGADYAIQLTVPPWDFRWIAGHPWGGAGEQSCGLAEKQSCYVINNGVLYVLKAVCDKAAPCIAGDKPPGCAPGETCSDGALNWTALKALYDPVLTATRNIFAWQVVNSQKAGAPQSGNEVPPFSQFFKFDFNLFYQAGETLVDYVRLGKPPTSFVDWRALYGQDVHSIVNEDPNFMDLANGDFNFRAEGRGAPCHGGRGGVSPACALGFEPWDYSDVGAREGDRRTIAEDSRAGAPAKAEPRTDRP